MNKVKKKLITSIIILVFVFPRYTWAEEDKNIQESKWRKFEILFSISLPFTFIASYLLVSSVDAAFSEGKMFSVRKKYHSSVLATAIILSSLIALEGLKENSKFQEMER